MSLPIFPLDLERQIFETAARLADRTPSKLCTLFLVARRVHAWIEPLLYEPLRIDTDSSGAISRILNGPDSLKCAIKTLMLYQHPTRIENLLSACREITRLILTECIPYSVLAHLRPTRLSLGTLEEIKGPPMVNGQSILDLPFFSCVTHLEINQSFLHLHPPFQFDRLPCLTHLAFYVRPVKGGWKETEVLALEAIISSCRRLQMLALLFEQNSDVQLAVETLLKRSPLPIYISHFQTYNQDWADCLTGEDIWGKSKHYSSFRALLSIYPFL
jgi:hypothetical protein